MVLIRTTLEFINNFSVKFTAMVIVLLVCVGMFGCTKREGFDEPLYYKIYNGEEETDRWNFYYDLYDSSGNLVKHDCTYMEQPDIQNVSNEILRVSVQAGTGLETRWTYYYDTRNNVFSPTYYYVLNEKDNFVAYYEAGNVIVCSMFEENYVKRINIPTELKNIENPVDEVYFSEDLKSLQIIYVDGSSETVTL